MIFGKKSRLDMMIEEMAELTVAIQHYKRNQVGSLYSVIEEAVDVEIMLSQLKEMIDINTFNRYKFEKIERLKSRIEARKVKK